MIKYQLERQIDVFLTCDDVGNKALTISKAVRSPDTLTLDESHAAAKSCCVCCSKARSFPTLVRKSILS
jgi:hypothetical protein